MWLEQVGDAEMRLDVLRVVEFAVAGGASRRLGREQAREGPDAHRVVAFARQQHARVLQLEEQVAMTHVVEVYAQATEAVDVTSLFGRRRRGTSSNVPHIVIRRGWRGSIYRHRKVVHKCEKTKEGDR